MKAINFHVEQTKNLLIVYNQVRAIVHPSQQPLKQYWQQKSINFRNRLDKRSIRKGKMLRFYVYVMKLDLFDIYMNRSFKIL